MNPICCGVVHLLFLGFNAVALKIFSAASGSRTSSLVNKKNARALMVVCSSVFPVVQFIVDTNQE